MVSVLLSGFEPFDGAGSNNSWDAVRLVEAVDVETVLLPVEFGRASDVLDAAIARHRPLIVIGVGLAENRTTVTPERIAVNIADARIPDNAGAQPIDEPLVAGGVAAHFARLPVKTIVAAIQAEGVPAAVSESAGTYVCNAVMYRLLHDHPDLAAGFVHVPPAEVLGPSVVARALDAAIRAIRG